MRRRASVLWEHMQRMQFMNDSEWPFPSPQKVVPQAKMVRFPIWLLHVASHVRITLARQQNTRTDCGLCDLFWWAFLFEAWRDNNDESVTFLGFMSDHDDKCSFSLLHDPSFFFFVFFFFLDLIVCCLFCETTSNDDNSTHHVCAGKTTQPS